MNRRHMLIVVTAWPALACAGAALGQSKRTPVSIGWLHTDSRDGSGHLLAAFTEALAILGWKGGSEVVIHDRWADGRIERLQSLAVELATKKPAVIVAFPTQSVGAAAKAAPKVPIVQAAGADPVLVGLAASLAQPGGMVTGLSNINTDLAEKYLELLLTAAPQLRRVGFLMDSTNFARVAQMEAARRSIARYPIEASFAEAGKLEEVETALSSLAGKGVQGLIVIASPLFVFERRRIIKFALERRWPLIAARHEFPADGALLSYGPDIVAQFRRAADFVHRILKGARPGDLPIEQPTTLELVMNRKTAKLLGLTISPTLLLQVDRVID